jgi:DNA-binding transcriptional LysR family regulator
MSYSHNVKKSSEEREMKALPETRHLVAVVTLADELNFTRAARRLKISQSGLSKQVKLLEERYKLRLFVRDHAHVALTDAGRVFIEEAKLSLIHNERAVRLARVAGHGTHPTITIGRSPYTSPALIAALLSVRLPRFPELRINLHSDFAPELVHGLLVSQLDLALIANPERNRKLTMTKISETPLSAVLPTSHPLARRSSATLRDFSNATWILFDRKAHPSLHDSILRRAAEENITIKNHQTILGVDEAYQLVIANAGIAFMGMTGAQSIAKKGVAIIPISDEELNIEVCLASRADDRSRLVSGFVRAYMKNVNEIK